MAKLVPGKNGWGKVNQWEKGESGNPAGRPRKYINELKGTGYSLIEINDCIQVLMSMTLEELAKVYENPNGTILEKTICKAMIKSLEKGSLFSLETLLTRVYGKPKEIAQVQTDSVVEVVFTKGKTIL